ncbi:MAG TPA: CDP-diacylglycerol--serine O-phosphatidyltransferase [Candidatus Kapabacteria bacterium]|nr:CDP-diacylglycerol--serine O-phosphatidyltransferase [Candidatus Kapabacteria bacterium]
MKRIRVTRSLVPNLLTLVNLFCGFAAIVYASQHLLEKAAIFILIAAVFDMLDGFAARLIKAASEFGAELDSLCDVVSFGVAPSFMLYQAYFFQYNEFGILLSSFPALAGASRLARFNIQLVSLEDKKYFTGLPIPSGALTILSYLIFFHGSLAHNTLLQTIAIFVVTIVTSLVMVSTIKFNNLPRPNLQYIKENKVFSLLSLVGLISIIITKGQTLFLIMAIYIIISSIRHLFVLYNKNEIEDDDLELEESEESDNGIN